MLWTTRRANPRPRRAGLTPLCAGKWFFPPKGRQLDTRLSAANGYTRSSLRYNGPHALLVGVSFLSNLKLEARETPPRMTRLAGWSAVVVIWHDISNLDMRAGVARQGA